MDKEPGSRAVLDSLTPEEMALLKRLLSRLELDLFQSVLSRLKAAVAIIATLLALFGIASFATLRSAIVESVANKMATDSELREEVVAEAIRKLEKVNVVIAKSAALDRQLDAERARAMTLIEADLRQILQMILQLQKDIQAPGGRDYGTP